MISYSGLKDKVHNFCRQVREDPYSSKSSEKLFISMIGAIGLFCGLAPIGGCILEQRRNCADEASQKPAAAASQKPIAVYYDLSSMLLSQEEQLIADIIRPDDKPLFDYQRISKELDETIKGCSDSDPYGNLDFVYKNCCELEILMPLYHGLDLFVSD